MKFSKKTLILASCMVLCITMTAFGTVAYLTDRASVANTFTVGNIEITVDESRVDEYGKPVDVTGKKDVDTDGDGKPDTPMNEAEYDAWTKDNGISNEPPFAELPDAADRTVVGNAYKLIPGAKYAKDPRMTVKAGNEKSYVRMIVKINKIKELKEILKLSETDKFLPQYFVEGWDNSVWVTTGEIKEDTVNNINTYEFRYYMPIDASDEDTVLAPLFTEMLIPAEFTQENISDNNLNELRIEIEGHAIQTAVFEDEADSENKAWAAFDQQYNP